MRFLRTLIIIIIICSRRANPMADALSRFQFQRFRHLAPQADLAATPIPPDLLEALLVTSRTGAISSSPRASLSLHVGCTSLHSVATLIFVNLMAILVLKVLFSQPTSSPSCVLPQYWQIALITPPSWCTSVQYDLFTSTTGQQILSSIVYSFSGFRGGLSGCKVLLPPSVFPSRLMFCKLLSVL